MFKTLTENISGIVNIIRRKGKLTEKDIDEIARKIKVALLESDVSLNAVKYLIDKLKFRILNKDSQNFIDQEKLISVLNEEIIFLLGGIPQSINKHEENPEVELEKRKILEKTEKNHRIDDNFHQNNNFITEKFAKSSYNSLHQGKDHNKNVKTSDISGLFNILSDDKSFYKSNYKDSKKNKLQSILKIDKKSKIDNNSEKIYNTILMIGLQGSGKTTSVAKLAKFMNNVLSESENSIQTLKDKKDNIRIVSAKSNDHEMSNVKQNNAQTNDNTMIDSKIDILSDILYDDKKSNNNILLISFDIHRPAAIDQLKKLADSNNIDCFYDEDIMQEISLYNEMHYIDTESKDSEYSENDANFQHNAKKINLINKIFDSYQDFLQKQKQNGIKYDFCIVDTAGRTTNDADMLEELRHISNLFNPDEVLLVADSLLGQGATKIAQQFNQIIPITGIVLTRIDSDAKGGAALSLRSSIDAPIKFMSNGEKIDDFNIFEAERIASIIVGNGDLEGLFDRGVEKIIDKSSAEKMIQTGKMNFNDMLVHLKGLEQMGSIKNILNLIPGMSSFGANIKEKDDAKNIQTMISLINSMTHKERLDPHLMIRDYSRRQRVCRGAGKARKDMDALIKFYEKIRVMIEQFSKSNPQNSDNNPKNIGNLMNMLKDLM